LSFLPAATKTHSETMERPKIEIIVTQDVPGTNRQIVVKAEIDVRELDVVNGLADAVVHRLLVTSALRLGQEERGEHPPPNRPEIAG
jgi:hypothetical protein